MGGAFQDISFEVVPRYLRISFNGSGITTNVMYDGVDLWTKHVTYKEVHNVEEAVRSVFSNHPELLTYVGVVGIAVTTVLLWRKWKLRATAIAQNSVIFAFNIPHSKEVVFDNFVESGKMQEELQEAWADKGKYLKEAFNDKSMVGKIMETLKGVEIGSVEKCDEAVAVKAIKASKEKLKSSTGDVAGTSVTRPLAVTGLRLRTAQDGKGGSKGVVFFDDPNSRVANKFYVITAWDAETDTEVEQESTKPYVTLNRLQPGRSYIIFVEVVVGGLKSDRTFYDELLHMYHDELPYARGNHPSQSPPEYTTRAELVDQRESRDLEKLQREKKVENKQDVFGEGEGDQRRRTHEDNRYQQVPGENTDADARIDAKTLVP